MSSRRAIGTLGLATIVCFSEVTTLTAKATKVTDTVNATRGSPVTVRSASLRIELLRVTDSRCPREVQCVWAGHAAVQLRVTQRGSPAETLSIGTRAPDGMKLPFDATVAGHRLHLVRLTPAPSVERKVSAARYRASIEIGPG